MFLKIEEVIPEVKVPLEQLKSLGLLNLTICYKIKY